MKFTETTLKGAYVIASEPRRDERGSFERSFCAREFAQRNLRSNMVQSNLSRSLKKHTLRGMHFQVNGSEEAKLVRCIRGSILDVIIDLRPESSTYCRHFSVELTDCNDLLLYVPEGFAHGFISLEDNTEVFYQVSNYYSPENERGVRWNDKAFGIHWPTDNPILSPKDGVHPDYQPVQKK